MKVLIILLLFTQTCLAGIDFSMSSHQWLLPEFTSSKEAEKFSRDTKYVPAIFNMLMDRYIQLHNDHDSLAYYYWDAILVMEDLKRRGIRGDNSMVGSSCYAGENPIIK